MGNGIQENNSSGDSSVCDIGASSRAPVLPWHCCAPILEWIHHLSACPLWAVFTSLLVWFPCSFRDSRRSICARDPPSRRVLQCSGRCSTRQHVQLLFHVGCAMPDILRGLEEHSWRATSGNGLILLFLPAGFNHVWYNRAEHTCPWLPSQELDWE